jgi:hypothetical protein
LLAIWSSTVLMPGADNTLKRGRPNHVNGLSN